MALVILLVMFIVWNKTIMEPNNVSLVKLKNPSMLMLMKCFVKIQSIRIKYIIYIMHTLQLFASFVESGSFMKIATYK